MITTLCWKQQIPNIDNDHQPGWHIMQPVLQSYSNPLGFEHSSFTSAAIQRATTDDEKLKRRFAHLITDTGDSLVALQTIAGKEFVRFLAVCPWKSSSGHMHPLISGFCVFIIHILYTGRKGQDWRSGRPPMIHFIIVLPFRPICVRHGLHVCIFLLWIGRVRFGLERQCECLFILCVGIATEKQRSPYANIVVVKVSLSVCGGWFSVRVSGHRHHCHLKALKNKTTAIAPSLLFETQKQACYHGQSDIFCKLFPRYARVSSVLWTEETWVSFSLAMPGFLPSYGRKKLGQVDVFNRFAWVSYVLWTEETWASPTPCYRCHTILAHLYSILF